MIPSVFGLLFLLNPFALFLYLQPIMETLSQGDFRRVLVRASLISFLIFWVFMLLGEAIFSDFIQIRFDAFRIFGGVVLFSFAYMMIVRGEKALIQIRGDLSDLAADIALPFMVGAGTITLVILIGKQLVWWQATIALALVLLVNFGSIMALKAIREHIPLRKFRTAFDKVMEVLLRLNAFFLGSIGVDMIITGVRAALVAA